MDLPVLNPAAGYNQAVIIHRAVAVHVVNPRPGVPTSEAARNYAAVVKNDAAVIVRGGAEGDDWYWVAVGGDPVEAVWVPLLTVDEDDSVEYVRKLIGEDTDIYGRALCWLEADKAADLS